MTVTVALFADLLVAYALDVTQASVYVMTIAHALNVYQQTSMDSTHLKICISRFKSNRLKL
jgi:hypothetical protein